MNSASVVVSDDMKKRTKEAWRNMKKRCYGNTYHSLYRYKYRNITVCDEWFGDYEAFVSDMGYKPSLNHTLDRIDNDLGYFKENCRWVSSAVQARNRHNTKFIDDGGVRRPLTEAAKLHDISASVVRSRLARGWDDWTALNEPVRNNGKSRQDDVVCENPFEEIGIDMNLLGENRPIFIQNAYFNIGSAA